MNINIVENELLPQCHAIEQSLDMQHTSIMELKMKHESLKTEQLRLRNKIKECTKEQEMKITSDLRVSLLFDIRMHCPRRMK